MDINRANLNAIFRSISTAWQQGMEWKPPVDMSFLVRDYPSAGASNFYAFIHQMEGFREWLGDRIWQNLRSGKFELTNRDFERSYLMPANDILDDIYGVYAPLWQDNGAAWQQLLYSLVIEVFTSNPTCSTGKALFANDHEYGGQTIDNLTANALSKTNFEQAFIDTAAWRYANGELIRPMWTHLLHGPKLRSTAFSLVDAKQISDGSGNLVDNPNFQRCKRVEIPDFVGAYDDYWALVDGSKPVKAFARQIRKTPTPIMDTRPEEVELTGEVKMFAHGRAAAAGAMPHLVYMARL